MKVVVIGDVSWKASYHLGDEAMTEVAIAELRRRGAEVTLIAGDPVRSAAFYGVDTVPQFGFRTLALRSQWTERLDEITRALAEEIDTPAYASETLQAINAADAVVIAGGGNLNSEWGHHIFERLALARAARRAGIPLFVTSQTVGPELIDEDRVRIRELITIARVVGAREPQTAALLREIGGEGTEVVHTLDDALLLEPAELTSDERVRLGATDRYIVGSFTFHPRTTGLHPEDYYRRVATALDEIVERCDADVLLLPHMGSLEERERSAIGSDVRGHDRIAAYTKSGRVRSQSMMTARELVSMTAGARFTISTRYHPVVFGAGVGVPAIGLVTSYYSAIRMRGALGNVGMEQFAIPFEAWQSVFSVRMLEAMTERRDEFASAAGSAGDAARAYQMRWWDGIVASIAGTGTVEVDDVSPQREISWADDSTRDLLAVTRAAQESTNLVRLNVGEALRMVEQKNAESAAQLSDAKRHIHKLNRALDDTRNEIADLRHLRRPPGAEFRDRTRGALRRIFGRGE